MKSDPLWGLDKEFKSAGWFKKNAPLIISSIDTLLLDSSFSHTTVRLAILLLANLNTLLKQSGPIKTFLKNNQTVERFSQLFETFLESDFLTSDIIEELLRVLKVMFPLKEFE